MQYTNHLLMIQPVNFGFNAEPAINNSFQVNTTENVQEKALMEFNDFVTLLREYKVDVTVIPDTTDPFTPDSIFPNNWISFHEDGSIFRYPMFAANRRKEKKQHILDILQAKFLISTIHDLGKYENDNLFLEGTGSMILDRDNRIAYACISPRTSLRLLNEFCALVNYSAISFFSKDLNGMDIYHTNVMMCIADRFAVICLESIPDKNEQASVIKSLAETNKEIIAISLDQMNHFAGNMLQVCNVNAEPLLVMSTQAYHSLTADQIIRLEKYNPIIHSPLNHIETSGGGSARCMMAEIFNRPR